MALSKIPFLEPSQLLSIVQLVRQQLVYNCLYSSCCGPPPGDGGRGQYTYKLLVVVVVMVTVVYQMLQTKQNMHSISRETPREV